MSTVINISLTEGQVKPSVDGEAPIIPPQFCGGLTLSINGEGSAPVWQYPHRSG